MSPRVLLIGWDAADWKVMGRLMDAGRMPNLERLARGGASGNLATLRPVLSPMLWTSIATGKRAHKHGIHGFSEPDPLSGGVRPITNLGRRCKAIWNILQQNGLRSNVVGWWPSHPAEPINGVMVSNHFQQAVGSLEQPWPMRPGTVHPPHLAEALAEFRFHPGELEGDMLLPFVPGAAAIDQHADPRLAMVARVLAETVGVHAAATALLQLEPCDFMAVYFDGIDHFSHGFMKYHPPRLPWVSEADFELYQHVVAAGYAFHDQMLGTYLELIDDQTTVILVSDHGFHPDHLRPRELPNEPAGPAEEHRSYGMVLLHGPAIRTDATVFGASLLDITPTILTLFDLPVGEDMDGRPLLQAFRDPPTPTSLPSWDAVAGDAGLHPAGTQADPVDQHAALRQLVDLGYIDAPDTDRAEAAAAAVLELRYNLARDLLDAGHTGDAIALLEELWHSHTDQSRFGLHLIAAQLQLGRVAEAAASLALLEERKRTYAAAARAELQALEEQNTNEEQNKESEAEAPDEARRRRLHRLRRQAGTNSLAFGFLRGRLHAAAGRHREALEEFERLRGVELHHQPGLLGRIGHSQLALGQLDAAEASFHAMRALDPVDAESRLGLARVALRRGQASRALDYATACLGLERQHPQAHLLCARALLRLGRQREALVSLQTALDQNPLAPGAHRLLARLLWRQGRVEEAAERVEQARAAAAHLRAFRTGSPLPRQADLAGEAALARTASLEALSCPAALEADPSAVVVVSGLPRSGTSMLMQMLAAGGLPLLVDDQRPADPSNSRGYLEFEPVKRLGRPGADSSWLESARGHAVKVVAPLLRGLPQGRPYRILFMERPLRQIVASQGAMLQRLGKSGANLTDRQLAAAYLRQVEDLESLLAAHGPELRLLALRHGEALTDPAALAERINRFLGGGLDTAAMAAAVDPSLWRERH